MEIPQEIGREVIARLDSHSQVPQKNPNFHLRCSGGVLIQGKF